MALKGKNIRLDFASGIDNQIGLQIKLTYDEDTHSVYGKFTCPERFQNVDGKVHPGILATILDEIMMQINRSMNFASYTSEITVRYLNQASVKETLYLRGWFVKKNRRTIESRSEIENDIGKIVARAKGKYIEEDDDVK